MNAKGPLWLNRKSILDLKPSLEMTLEEGALRLCPAGSWTAAHATALEEIFSDLSQKVSEVVAVQIDIAGITALDTLGAWILEKIQRRSILLGQKVQAKGIPQRFAGLINEVRLLNRRQPAAAARQNPLLLRLEGIGRSSVGALEDVSVFFQMLGAMGASFLNIVRRPRSLRLT